MGYGFLGLTKWRVDFTTLKDSERTLVSLKYEYLPHKQRYCHGQGETGGNPNNPTETHDVHSVGLNHSYGEAPRQDRQWHLIDEYIYQAVEGPGWKG